MLVSPVNFVMTPPFYGNGGFSFPPLVNRIIDFCRTHFKLMESAAFLTLGTKEIVYDNKRIRKTWPSITSFFRALIEEFKKKDFGIIHGALYMAVGITSSIIVAHQYQLLNLTKWIPFLSNTSNGLFIAANIFALNHYGNLYREALFEKDPVIAGRMRVSAAMGILSSLGYILVPLLTLFGAPIALPIVLGGIAVATGCIKILYDYFFSDFTY